MSLFIVTALLAQQRGFKPITVEGTGTTTLYKQSHALIIGMSNYTSGWPKLVGVEKDIPEVKAALEQNGFNVLVEKDLTREQLDKTFIDFIATYGQDPENRLVFYFAGHGHTLNNFGEVNGYIVPVDAPNPNLDKAGFITKAMPMSRIEEYAKQAGSKHALFLFDACFSGSLFATSRAVPDVISYKTALPVRQFITSGSADETVPDESIFRQQFVIALTTAYADANSDGYLTGTELGTFLLDNVVNYSRNSQHPQYGKIRNPYLDKGDFVFVLGGSQPDPIAPNINNGQQTNATGNLKLISDYTGTAKITSVSGTQLQTTNVTEGGTYDFYNLPAGIIVINIYSGSQIVWTNKVSIQANHTTTIKAEKTTGSIQLISQISGSLYIDGVYTKSISANNTYTISDLTGGNHTLKIGNEWQETIYITAGQTTTIQAEKPTGTLQLTTSLSGNFYIDDIMREYVSSGNRTYTGIDPGNHTAKIVSGGQTLWQSSFTIYARQTTTITAQAQNQNNNMSNFSGSKGTFTDIRDNKTYNWVKIGNQIWMAENLAYKPSSGNYWAYDNNSGNVSKYGYLYDWETAKNVCPAGWHLPSDAEWTTLTNYLGGERIAGGKMKATSGWKSPNTGATNSSGFTALPGGYRSAGNGSFYSVGDYGNWWSSTATDAGSAYNRRLYYGTANAYRLNRIKKNGFAVRCLKD